MVLTQNTQKGFSLLELLLVVAVGAILILAGLAIYRNITNNTQINEASRLLNVLKQETQRIYQGESTYGVATDIEPILINAEAVPAKYVQGANIISPFNEGVNVVGDTDNFTIELENVTQAACIKLGLEYSDNDPDFELLSIGGADTATTVIAVDAACEDDVEMVWTFN